MFQTCLDDQKEWRKPLLLDTCVHSHMPTLTSKNVMTPRKMGISHPMCTNKPFLTANTDVNDVASTYRSWVALTHISG